MRKPNAEMSPSTSAIIDADNTSLVRPGIELNDPVQHGFNELFPCRTKSRTSENERGYGSVPFVGFP